MSNEQRFTFKPAVSTSPTPDPNEPYSGYQTQAANTYPGFSCVTPYAQMPSSAVTPMNMGNLVQHVEPPKSVGLPIHTLVEPATMAPKDGPMKTFDPQFNNLVGVDPNYRPQQKFALQPIAEDIDHSMLPKPEPVSSAVDDAIAHLNKAQARDYTVGKKLNNWFTRLLDQRGEDYITSGKLTIDEVSRNAEKILDDMIAGRIDYIKQGSILINPIIIDTLINYCANKLAINRAIQFALGYVYNDFTSMQNFYDDPERLASLTTIDDAMSRNITQAIAIVNQDLGVYDIMYRKLTFVEATKNVSSLFSLTNELNSYKKQVKKRY